MAKKEDGGRATQLGNVSNGGADTLGGSMPYRVEVELSGASDLLFHRWNVESIEEKSKAAKGSKAKKSDDIESYVYRNDDGQLCLPGEYVRQAVIHAAKFRQDPRSPRKSAMDLYKAGVLSLTHLATIFSASKQPLTDWDYEDRRRVQVQRNGVTRVRPAVKAGWRTTVQFLVNLPEYIPLGDFHDVLINAGRLIGVGDFRPTFGRFTVARIEILRDE